MNTLLTGSDVTPASDMAVRLRNGAVASLKAFATLAGDHVQAERVEGIATSDVPRIVVTIEEDGKTAAPAGTDPLFTMRAKLIVSGYIARADSEDAVADVDTLVAQIKEGLLADPRWISLSSPVEGLQVRRHFQASSDQGVLGEAHVMLDLTWRDRYPPRVTQNLLKIVTTTTAHLAKRPPPQIGAIRFDGWWGDPTVAGSVAQQLAQVLSPAQYQSRLPWFATIVDGQATWPVPTQATMDAEITAATSAGLAFWAFDSYQPTDPESLALQLYLSSSLRGHIGFAMLGQMSNWIAEDGSFNPCLARDALMFNQPGYLKTPDARPVYFVLQGGNLSLPQQQAAIAAVIAASEQQGSGCPYIVALAAAALTTYDDITNFAQPLGADAAGTYTEGLLNGTPQAYSALVGQAEQDWALRAGVDFPLVPTACAGSDVTPFVTTPEPFYPLGSWATSTNYFQQGAPADIAQHVADLANFIGLNPKSCPAGIGLVDAWNEYAEGAWIAPSYLPGSPSGDLSRCQALGAVLPAPLGGVVTAGSTIDLPPA